MHQNKFSSIAGALIATVAAATLLAACASSPKIFVNQDPAADFSRYRTYNYHQPLGTDQGSNYRAIISNYLMTATDREMANRGYQKSDNADLLINFNIATEEKIRTTQSPSMGGYYGYRGGYYGGYAGYDTTVTQYTQGTLNVDLIDTSSNTLVWEGIAEGTITDKVRQNVEAAVNTAIPNIFTRFNHYAPGFVPPTPPAGTK